MSIITTDLVALDVDAGGDKEAVIGLLAEPPRRRRARHRPRRPDRRRDGPRSTVGHRTSRRHRHPTLPLAARRRGHHRLRPAVAPVDFGAPDGPADLAFLIAAPESGGSEHMKLLSSLARALVRKEFVESLRNASSAAEVVELVEGVVNPAPAARRSRARRRRRRAVAAATPGRSSPSPPARPASRTPTWPPTRWSPPARRPASTCIVETQGSSGSTPLSAETIAAADAVIFATDVGVKDRGRFAGKPVIASGVKRAINEPAKMVAEALAAPQQSQRRQGRGRGGRTVVVRSRRHPAASAGAPAPGRSCSPASAT